MRYIKTTETRWCVEGKYPFVEKFFEAENFYNEMLIASNVYDIKKFKFNLSAFITAARSVTMIMSSQYKDAHYCKEWAKETKSKIKNDKYFKFLNDKRIETLKIKPIEIAHNQFFEFDPPLTNKNAVKVKKNGKTIFQHTIDFSNKNDVLIIDNINGEKNPENAFNIVNFYFIDTGYHVLNFCQYIMNNLSEFSKELCRLIKNNNKKNKKNLE